ncbi:primosomal protein N' [Alkaliphilus serpentinus]|uniref:Replication restart protein PriA n=1 Tax=Alkaliphilus serpentinus TaxID=1482731 RepID=A0A833MBD8_9FIRM|nr:primosomal protein N' [Alkaliphilus serpentinus]KAB3533142.1 primosomal protein N' [Alkaliphilus serpentinus]
MDSKKLVAQVIVDNNSHQTDKLFDYLIPPHLINILKIGMRVLVPFGKGNKRLEAYLLNIAVIKEESLKLKEIITPLDYHSILSENQIKMVFWMRKKYMCKFIEAIHCIIPTGIVNKEKRILHLTKENWRNFIPHQQHKQMQIMMLLEEHGGSLSQDLINKTLPFKDCYQAIKSLEEEGYLDIEYQLSSRVNIKREQYVKLKKTIEEIDIVLNELNRAPKQVAMLEYLLKHREAKTTDITKTINTTNATIRALEAKGLITIFEKESKRNPFSTDEVELYPKLKATEEQENIIKEIVGDIIDNRSNNYLIHGITGSGKTEIYLQLMEVAKAEGKEGIILVPEISLTPQTVERFRGRFGEGIAVFHSNLSEGERYDEWRRISEGKVDMVIGARSAIFAPFNNLGLIIVDEEHEQTYKSEQNPKYHAIDIAFLRGMTEKAVVVLGSATPSIENYYKAQKGEIKLRTLEKRPQMAKLPEVEVIDMKEELDTGNTSILSNRLKSLIMENLEKKKQTILFLNRRGYSTFVSCRSCGHVVKCNHCDISMTFHMGTKSLNCHYCGLKISAPTSCPSCNSNRIKYFGAGTQKLERVIEGQFPGARVARLDLDVTGKKGAHERILADFKKGNKDILIGTQMISKGLDFPNVTLVGIISIDSTLNLPDFRASERSFQLITQVAGRAGRSLQAGRVVLQTYDPNHFSIVTASKHDFKGFYNEELEIRKEFAYPPFNNLIALNFSGGRDDELFQYVNKIADGIRYILQSKGYQSMNDMLLGPNAAIIPKINNKYRYQILLKDHGVELGTLKRLIRYFFIQHRQKYLPKGILAGIDINPYNLM